MLIGIYGRQDSGKTKLVEELVKALSKDYTVATVKHIDRERFSVDTDGKDTWRHARAGAEAVVAASEGETAIIFKRGMPLHKVTEHLDADVVIVEGYKDAQIPKVAVGDIEETPGTLFRFAGNPTPILEHIRTEVEVERVYGKLGGLDCRKCGNNCIDLARKVVRGEKSLEDCLALQQGLVSLTVDGDDVELTAFPEKMVYNVVKGLVESLKGGEGAGEIEIKVKLPLDQNQ